MLAVTPRRDNTDVQIPHKETRYTSRWPFARNDKHDFIFKKKKSCINIFKIQKNIHIQILYINILFESFFYYFLINEKKQKGKGN